MRISYLILPTENPEDIAQALERGFTNIKIEWPYVSFDRQWHYLGSETRFCASVNNIILCAADIGGTDKRIYVRPIAEE